MGSGVNIKNNKKNILHILSGMAVAIAVTLMLILLFAVGIRFLNIGDGWIFPINQIIKIISLIVGINIAMKRTKSKGFLSGILIGLLYFVISYIVFSILQSDFSFGMNNFYDLILTTLMGGLIGIILVNLNKK